MKHVKESEVLAHDKINMNVKINVNRSTRAGRNKFQLTLYQSVCSNNYYRPILKSVLVLP